MEVDRKSINSDPIKSNEITTADDRADIPKSPRGKAAGRQGGRAAGRKEWADERVVDTSAICGAPGEPRATRNPIPSFPSEEFR